MKKIAGVSETGLDKMQIIWLGRWFLVQTSDDDEDDEIKLRLEIQQIRELLDE